MVLLVQLLTAGRNMRSIQAASWKRTGSAAIRTRHPFSAFASRYSNGAWSSQGSLLRQSERSHVKQQHARSFWTLRGGGERKELEDLSKALPPIEPILNVYPISVCSVQGMRSYMEDEFVVTADCAAVFDGHGGQAVSRYLRQNLYASLQAALPAATTGTLAQHASPPPPASVDDTNATSQADTSTQTTDGSPSDSTAAPPKGPPTVEDYKRALKAALDKVDKEVQRIVHWSFQGSTAVAAWIHEEKVVVADNGDTDSASSASTASTTPQRTIVTANVGDSRAVLSRNYTAVDLTRDHKPNDPIEHARIEKKGGYVMWCGDQDAAGHPVLGTGIYRVNGNLALSRAVGDRSERPAVSAEPEITVTPITADDDFLVIATDGLWDVMTSADVVAFVHTLLDAAADDETEREYIASVVVEEALRRGSWDNITVVIVWLNIPHDR